MVDKRTIEEVAETLRGVQGRGKGCCLLIGAGCSVKAGIPTAPGFVDRIKEKHPLAYDRAKKKQYPQCMAQLTWDERHDIVAEYVDSAKINWAHVGIACLIQAGFVDRVLTTNFDPLVVRACSLLNEFPAVYDFATSQLYRPNDIVEKAVIHLHGQRSGFVQLSTKKECDDHAKLMQPVFEDSGRGRSWIVVGYSGESDPVSGHDADSFFVRLAQELDVFPPSLVALPFTHLSEILDTLAPFSLPDQKSDLDVTAQSRGWIEKAVRQFEKSEVAPEVAQIEKEKSAAIEGLKGKITKLFMSGDYQLVLDRADETGVDLAAEPDMADKVSWSYVMLGIMDSDAAQSAKPKEAVRLFDEAGEKYKAALDIKPDMHEALNNWGFALWEQAKTKNGEEAERLFVEAGEKYAAALDIKPDMHAALNNWGLALSDQAKTKSGEEAERLLAEAREKFEAVQAMNPGHASYNLACLKALQGDEQGCRAYLEESRETGFLPGTQHLAEDSDLDSVRHTEWFRKFVS